jgi:hypothetical protein
MTNLVTAWALALESAAASVSREISDWALVLGVAVGLAVAVAVGVEVGVAVAMAVGVDVGVEVAVAVGVAVAVLSLAT